MSVPKKIERNEATTVRKAKTETVEPPKGRVASQFGTTNDPKALQAMLKRLPRISGTTQVGDEQLDSEEILNRVIELLPKMFRYKELLAKAEGGMGSKKAIDRFSTLVSGQALKESHEQYIQTLESLNDEVAIMIGHSSNPIQVTMPRDVQEQIASLQVVKSTIGKFQSKLQNQMAKVETASQKMVDSMANVIKKEKNPVLREELKKIETKLMKDTREIRQLMMDCDEYCELQIGFNNLFIGEINAQNLRLGGAK